MKLQTPVLSPADCFLLHNVPPSAAAAIVRRLPPPVSFRKGDTVEHREGARALGILLSGAVSVNRRGAGGKEQRCNRLAAGEAFGAAALFCDEPPAVSRVVATSDGTVWFLPEADLLALLRQEPAVAENFARFLTDRIRFLNRSLNGLRGGTATDRVFSHLRSLADQSGTLTLPPLSTLAATLSMGRTSLYRALNELEQSGALTKNGKTVTLYL